MKVSLHSQKEYERKIQKLERKTERLTEKCQSKSKDLKYLKRRVKELRLSRDKWKAKNHAKALKAKELKKRLKNKERVKRHHYSSLLIALCIKLRVQAGCSYRGICKILLILRTSFALDLKQLPCSNTIENWVSKMGYYCIEHAEEDLGSKEVCMIIDESFRQGNERLLLLLITAWQKEKQEALSYDEVRVCYLGGKKGWNGEQISQEIENIVAQKGIVIKNIVSDEDSKMLKVSRLLGCPHLPDINHAIANCLRRTFEKDDTYQSLIKLIGSYQSKAVNQALSYLRPPKQRVKARFMNQKDFVQWGLTMLAKFECLNEKEKTFFAELPAYRPMLKILGWCIDLTEKVTKFLKASGLSWCSLRQVESYMGRPKQLVFKSCAQSKPQGNISYDNTAVLMEQFLDHLRGYLDQYELFLNTHTGTFNVSSDIIESMFGKHKSISGTNTLVGVSQLDLELPVHNMDPEAMNPLVKLALESVLMSDLKSWREAHCADKQADKRRKFFKTSPHFRNY